MKLATLVILALLCTIVTGCSSFEAKEETELPAKVWHTDQYSRVENVYNSDDGNYAIAFVEAQMGERRVGFSFGNDKPMAVLKGKTTAHRMFSSLVKYPGSGEELEVREVYLMSRGKRVDYAFRRW